MCIDYSHFRKYVVILYMVVGVIFLKDDLRRSREDSRAYVYYDLHVAHPRATDESYTRYHIITVDVATLHFTLLFIKL